MPCGQLLGPYQARLAAISATVQYHWLTGWFPATGVDNIKGVLRNCAVDGNFQSRLVLQLATIRTDDPSAPVLLEASYLQDAGERCTGVLDISNSTASKYFMRLGIAYSVHTGSSIAAADVGLELAYNSCGEIIGATSLDLVTPGTNSLHTPITGWVPAMYAAKVKAIIIVTNAIGNGCGSPHVTVLMLPLEGRGARCRRSSRGDCVRALAWRGTGGSRRGRPTPSRSAA